MILKEEILVQADEHNLFPTTIEKDYVLSWVLWGIFLHPLLSSKLVFKGGTCLKKCFFGSYRFSEDLDFTLTKPTTLIELEKSFQEVCEWVQENSRIMFFQKKQKFEEYKTPRGNLAFQGRLRYQGPLKHKTSFPKIKLDITAHEILVEKPSLCKVLHHYSDSCKEEVQIATYSFEEVFAEKIRALIQRSRPRDLYDVIHLNNQQIHAYNKALVRDILLKKCNFAKVPYPEIEKLLNRQNKEFVATGWSNMLAHQISGLEPVEHYWKQLPEVFSWIQQV
ncbi:MAG: nucleotidyl transferase AbiEii/AbiGii toxin family protein [Candidatus Algichlamydia australiensis]|nr:nucleotidyl transferase AbiEii/AbiGii toxin family protein [Chlamydiales bacterium]